MLQLHVSRCAGEGRPAELPVAAGGERFGGGRTEVGENLNPPEILQPQLDSLVGVLGQLARLQPSGHVQVPLPLGGDPADVDQWSGVLVEHGPKVLNFKEQKLRGAARI